MSKLKKLSPIQRAKIHGQFNTGYKMVCLRRDGQDILIRDKRGYWEMLEYVNQYGEERWGKVPDTIDVDKHIELYSIS